MDGPEERKGERKKGKGEEREKGRKGGKGKGEAPMTLWHGSPIVLILRVTGDGC